MKHETKIPEIDIKVDSVAVTAVTKKLKAKWSPELAQDLNAYHNLDAEVELTSVLSEQIALEIDQEILSDLVVVLRRNPLLESLCLVSLLTVKTEAFSEARSSQTSPERLAEWYETLLETINEVSARIHRKTLRGGANFHCRSPEVANILEFTSGFRAAAAVDEEGGIGESSKSARLAARWISTLILTSSETSFWLDARATASLKADMFMLRMSHCKSRRPFLVPKTSCPARA